MLVDVLTALHDSGLAAALRHGRWSYAAVNTGHILGIALLFGSIVPLDLRLLGLWGSVPLDSLARILVPVSVAGTVLVLATGFLLFSVQPVKYVQTGLFQVKMVIVLGGLANALLVRRLRMARDHSDAGRCRVAALLSIGFWLSAIVCGRMLGYI